jgi:pimeloyl-ACP methyl ester carboxylesterase
VRTLNDLLTLVVRQLDQPADLVAQSMGGILALKAALELPRMVKHLVLRATSGGVDLTPFQPHDWRKAYQAIRIHCAVSMMTVQI